jgi:hypothetical protein
MKRSWLAPVERAPLIVQGASSHRPSTSPETWGGAPWFAWRLYASARLFQLEVEPRPVAPGSVPAGGALPVASSE